MILTLIQNVALLVALTALYRKLVPRFREKTLGYHLTMGLLFGGVGVIGMMTPLNLLPGIFFDGRIIILSVAGLIGGPLTALISAVICSGYRLWLGGAGAVVGVATVIESAAIGALFYSLRRRIDGPIPLRWMWVLGLIVTLVELTLFLGLPGGAGETIIREVGLVILVMYPAATALVATLLQDAELQTQDRDRLSAREAELRKAHELAHLGSWTWRVASNRLELSEQARKILQFNPDDTQIEIDQAIKKFVHPDDTARLLEIRRTMDDHQLKAPIEFRVCLQDIGERRIWAEVGGVTRDTSGRLLTVSGILQDITARRAAEEMAQESENRYRNLFMHSPDAVFVNRESRVMLVNHAGVKLFGAQDADDLIGKSIYDLFHPDFHEQIRERVYRLNVLGEAVPVAEERIVRLDGVSVDVDVIAAPFITHAGNDIHVIIRDITERKQMEAALRESHQMLTGIAQQAPGVVYQYRLYPDGRSCFPYATRGIWEIYEVTPEEVREDATVVFGRLHPDDRARVTEEILDSARNLSMFHTEFRVILPEQGHRWRISNATPERTPDGGTLWYGIIMDDTERKKAEQQIKEQLDELRRWHSVMLGREKRNIELKKEVNELLRAARLPPRYESVETGDS